MLKGIFKTRQQLVDAEELENGNFKIGEKELTPEEFNSMYEPDKRSSGGISTGSFFLKKEGLHLKIVHRSLDFSLRVYAGARVDDWFDGMTSSSDKRKGVDIIFAAFKFFCITCIQNYSYFVSFCEWNEKYWNEKRNANKVSEEEDQEIIREQRDTYNEERKS